MCIYHLSNKSSAYLLNTLIILRIQHCFDHIEAAEARNSTGLIVSLFNTSWIASKNAHSLIGAYTTRGHSSIIVFKIRAKCAKVLIGLKAKLQNLSSTVPHILRRHLFNRIVRHIP